MFSSILRAMTPSKSKTSKNHNNPATTPDTLNTTFDNKDDEDDDDNDFDKDVEKKEATKSPPAQEKVARNDVDLDVDLDGNDEEMKATEQEEEEEKVEERLSIPELWKILDRELRVNIGTSVRCGICLCTVVEPMRTPCVHAFCKDCILASLESTNNRCPLCNTKINKRSLQPFEYLEQLAQNYKTQLVEFGFCPSTYQPKFTTLTQKVVVDEDDDDEDDDDDDDNNDNLLSAQQSWDRLAVATTWQQRALPVVQPPRLQQDENAAVVEANEEACQKQLQIRQQKRRRQQQQQQQHLPGTQEVLDLAREQQAADQQWQEQQQEEEEEGQQPPPNSSFNDEERKERKPSPTHHAEPSAPTTTKSRRRVRISDQPPVPMEQRSSSLLAREEEAWERAKKEEEEEEKTTNVWGVGEDDSCGALRSTNDNDNKNNTDHPDASSDEGPTSILCPSRRRYDSVVNDPMEGNSNTDDEDYDDDDDDKTQPMRESQTTASPSPNKAGTTTTTTNAETPASAAGTTTTISPLQDPTLDTPAGKPRGDDNENDDKFQHVTQRHTRRKQKPNDGGSEREEEEDSIPSPLSPVSPSNLNSKMMEMENAMNLAPIEGKENISTSANTQPPISDTSVATPQWTTGTIVRVQSRTWPGVNKPGGVARIVEFHPADGTYNVAYVLGGRESNVDAVFISSQDDPDKQGTRRRSRYNSTELPIRLLQELDAQGFDTTGRLVTHTPKRKPKRKATGASAAASKEEPMSSHTSVLENNTNRQNQCNPRKKRAKSSESAATATAPVTKKPSTRAKNRKRASANAAVPRPTATAAGRRKRKSSEGMTAATTNVSSSAQNSRQGPVWTIQETTERADRIYKESFQVALSEKTIHVVASNLSEEDDDILRALCSKPLEDNVKVKLSESVLGKKTTLCIMPMDDERDGGSFTPRARTLKAMRAALAGVPIISPEWIHACGTGNKAILPTKFARSLSTKTQAITTSGEAQYGVARLASLLDHPSSKAFLPFHNLSIFLCGNFTQKKREDIQRLSKEAGARLLKSPSEASSKLGKTKVVLVCNEATGTVVPGVLEKEVKKLINPLEIPLVVNPNWVFDSITCAKALPANAFEPSNLKAKELWKLCIYGAGNS